MWKGAIGFGLVSIPIELVAATGDHDIHFHQVHRQDGGRVRNKRVCEIGGHEVDYRDLAKGYEDPVGRRVILTDDDLEDELPLPSKHLIDVLAFVDERTLDRVRYGRAYCAVPAVRASEKAYVLLRETMTEQGRAAVAKVSIGTRESLALLRAKGNLLVLHTMYWPDEVRDPPRPAADVASRPQELQMMAFLMERLSASFRLDDQVDERTEALRQLVDAKLKGSEPPHGKVREPDTSGVVDLVDALHASLAATGAADSKTAPAEKRRGRQGDRGSTKSHRDDRAL